MNRVSLTATTVLGGVRPPGSGAHKLKNKPKGKLHLQTWLLSFIC